MDSPVIGPLYRLLVTHRKTAGQFVRFGVVGACNTVLDFAIYLVLTRGFPFWREHFVTAAAISFCFGATSSFVLNTFWTFRRAEDGWHRRMPKFFLVAVSGLAWNSAVLWTLTFFGLHDIIAKLAATGIVAFWNFTMHKKWTFDA
jgi:putative flippase GtrA